MEEEIETTIQNKLSKEFLLQKGTTHSIKNLRPHEKNLELRFIII